MKKLIIILLGLISLDIYGQEATKAEFDGHQWEAPYSLPAPEGWMIERFPIPISFAPQIPYRGVEDIRFSPGWGDVKSDGYWTYAFLWYLEDSQAIDAEIISGNLKAYYTGLIEVNRESHKVPAGKLVPVLTSFKESETGKGDLETFTGTIEMLDYIQQKPIILHCIAHIRSCPDDHKTILFFELSPKPFTHSNWSKLNRLWLDFQCKKNDPAK
jgi:hypothetical protein